MTAKYKKEFRYKVKLRYLTVLSWPSKRLDVIKYDLIIIFRHDRYINYVIISLAKSHTLVVSQQNLSADLIVILFYF